MRLTTCIPRTLMLAALLALAAVCSASGADSIAIETSAPAEVPVADAGRFDWDGFYAGIYGAAQGGGATSASYGVGVQAGVNTTFNFYLVGAEVAVQGLAGDIGTASEGQILGRAGLVVTDDVLVYAAGGYGIALSGPADGQALVGGGMEVALSDRLSLDAQYLRSIPTNGGLATHQVSVGANYHF
jgi:outer membrane immunogenic protein